VRASQKKDAQLCTAIWALQRILRKRAGFEHKEGPRTVGDHVIPGETCDCPQCIAKDAMERIFEIEEE